MSLWRLSGAGPPPRAEAAGRARLPAANRLNGAGGFEAGARQRQLGGDEARHAQGRPSRVRIGRGPRPRPHPDRSPAPTVLAALLPCGAAPDPGRGPHPDSPVAARAARSNGTRRALTPSCLAPLGLAVWSCVKGIGSGARCCTLSAALSRSLCVPSIPHVARQLEGTQRALLRVSPARLVTVERDSRETAAATEGNPDTATSRRG